MAATGKGLKLALLIDNQFQVLATDINLTCDSQKSKIDTIQGGFVGMTSGSRFYTVSVTGAVLSFGTEYPFMEKADSSDIVNIDIPQGATTFVGRGQITTASVRMGVNGNTEYSFEWSGTGEVS